MSTSEPLMRCRKEKDDVKTEVSSFTSGIVQGKPVYCLNGVRHIGGMKLIQALVWNAGTLHLMLRENPISANEGGKYRCR
jgi:hypothetical protein